jgi:hypothetical protein
MKIELCNKIKIIPVQYVLFQTNEDITPVKQKYLMKFTTGDNNFKQEGAVEHGNPYSNQSDERYVEGITQEQILLLFGMRVIVILQTTKGISRVWGDKEYPVTCNIDVFENGAKLKLSRKAPEPVVF